MPQWGPRRHRRGDRAADRRVELRLPQWGHGVTAAETRLHRSLFTAEHMLAAMGATVSPPWRLRRKSSFRTAGKTPQWGHGVTAVETEERQVVKTDKDGPQWGHGVTAVETGTMIERWIWNSPPQWGDGVTTVETICPAARRPPTPLRAAMGPRRRRRGDRSPGTRPFSRPNEQGFERSQWAPGADVVLSSQGPEMAPDLPTSSRRDPPSLQRSHPR